MEELTRLSSRCTRTASTSLKPEGEQQKSRGRQRPRSLGGDIGSCDDYNPRWKAVPARARGRQRPTSLGNPTAYRDGQHWRGGMIVMIRLIIIILERYGGKMVMTHVMVALMAPTEEEGVLGHEARVLERVPA
jgi:hypothetical protein